MKCGRYTNQGLDEGSAQEIHQSDGAMVIEVDLRFKVGFKVVLLGFWVCGFPCLSMDGYPQATVVLFPCSLSQGFQEATMGITLFVLSFLICFLAPWWIARGGVLHDRFLSSVAGDEACMAGDEFRIAEGEPRMTGDCCRLERSIHRCVRTHSHLYLYIYGLVALLDNTKSSFSKYHYFEHSKLDCLT